MSFSCTPHIIFYWLVDRHIFLHWSLALSKLTGCSLCVQCTMNPLATCLLLFILGLLHCAASQNVFIVPMSNESLVADNGDDFEVTCRYTAPQGIDSILWYRNGDLVNTTDNRITVASNGGPIARLTIRNVRLSDSGNYQCEINNQSQRSALSGYLSVISIAIIAPSPQQLIYGTNGTIECSSVNNTHAFWHTVNPKTSIISNGTYFPNNRGLNINNVQLHHQQQFMCEHVLLSNAELEKRIVIDIEVLVPSMITSRPSNISVVQGQTFNISFNYHAIPVPNFTWYINDNLHTAVQSTSDTNEAHTMVFSDATEEGWYRCVVQNELGTTEYTVFVDILVPPQVSPMNNQLAAVGRETRLSCVSSGDAPISFQWMYSGRNLIDNERISGAYTHTLIISRLRKADNGTYTCIATNPHGSDRADTSVIAVGLPKSLGRVNINGQSTKAEITWTIATSTVNHPVDFVYVNYHISGSSEIMSVRVSSETTQLTLQELIPDTAYIVNVIPSNMAGNHTNQPVHYFTTTVGAPKIDKILCQSNSYTSVELEVILQYTGGQPIIEFMIRFRVVDTTGWSSMVVATNHSNGTVPWYHSLTDLRFDQRGYEVEAMATNVIGSSNVATSSPGPITLYTELPGRPRARKPNASSITENSTTITCYVSDLGQPPLDQFNLAILLPEERVIVKRLPSYLAGANVTFVVDDLSSDTEYVFACYASSVVGDGEKSNQIKVRTSKSSITTTYDEASSEGNKKMAIYIGITSCVVLVVLLLIAILLLYFCCVKKSNENKYFVKNPLSAEENKLQISPGVTRRQFNLEQAGPAGNSILRHQVSDSVNSRQEGLPTTRFSNTMSSTQEGLPNMRYSNTVTSNHGGLSSLQFSSQTSPISNGNHIPLSQQVSNGFSSSCTRQLSNPASTLNLQPGCSGSTATYPLSMDRITAHYHISGSLTSSSLYDDDDSKLSYPPSAFATVV